VQAQAWLSDRKRAEGRGVRLGDFELHPGIGAEVGYYSNPFYSDRPKGSAALRVAPHIFISTLRDERMGADSGAANNRWLALNAGLSAAFQHVFEYAVRDSINVDLNADATLAPDRPVSLRVFELLRRSATPFGDTAIAPEQRDSELGANYTNYYENAGVQLMFQSAGGLLKGGFGYRFGYSWFDDEGFKYNNNLTHNAVLNLGWEFLPKTALFYEASYTHQTYTELDNKILAASARTTLVDSDLITTRLGLNGAITSRIGATIALGYTAGFYKTGDEPDGLIGNVEVRYMPSLSSELAVTFDRAFLPSYQGNFQERNRVYARVRWLLLGALLFTARGGVEFLSFGRDATQGSTRDDRRYFGDLTGEYRFVDWLAGTVQLGVLVDDTDFIYRAMDNSLADPAKFTAFEGWLGVRAFL
jgi:hypothetical protein